MSLAGFLSLSSEDGAVPGSARQKGREGKIFVGAYEHTILAERYGAGPLELSAVPLLDPVGMPTTKRRHGVFIITKSIDRSTPHLHKAHEKGSKFANFELECWRIPPAGGGPNGVNEENHWTVILKGARIAAIRTILANVRVPANSALPEYEEVEFTYDSIKFEWDALTGNGGEVYKQSCPDLESDFTKQSLDAIAAQFVQSLGTKFGESVGGKLKELVKKEAQPGGEAPKEK